MRSDDWPTGKYRVILADPPWAYEMFNRLPGRGTAQEYYPTMTPEDIAALPVSELAEKDCALFLWATFPCLPQAIDLVRAWGFAYKTVAFTWVKTTAKIWEPFVGLGMWTRSNAEICLLATRGKPKRQAADVQQVILSPVREHSRKPDEQYRRIERLLEGPYCELFARYPRPNWTVWGNERRPRQMGLEEAA